MQPLTAKELEYIVDSMSNEDLLIKQCAMTSIHTQNPQIKQLCQHMMQRHQQHYHHLMNVMQHHASLAPVQPPYMTQ
ncbi:hypothetical protein [Marinicrinis sediminis]|uniref:Spore coat protein n=1 Tax=Marinicrinis sediminis TaxID=1652465 RepID=A0ABW5R9A1_9BACL